MKRLRDDDRASERSRPITITMPYLRKIRTRQFVPVVELAERSGLTKMTIWRLEHGKPVQMSTVKKLAAALNVDPHDLAVIRDDDESSEAAR